MNSGSDFQGINPTRAKVMVVIGIRHSPENLRLRVEAAVQNASEYTDIILSGGVPAPGVSSEAKQMHRLWSTDSHNDANSFQFHYEEDSQSTAQNAYYSIPIVQKIDPNLDRVTVVTNDFHAARTKLIFEQVFSTFGLDRIEVNVLVAATEPGNREELFTKEASFTTKSNLDWLLRNMTGHPFRLASLERIEIAQQELQQYRRGSPS